MSGSYMGQSLQFLTLMPKYKCYYTNPLETFECVPQKKEGANITSFCDHVGEIHFERDTSDDQSLDNWFIQLELQCTPKIQIGLIGSMQFVGWAASSFVVPRLSDLHGRKWPYIGSMILQLICMIATFFSKDIIVTIVIMFFLGFSGVGRCSISFLYLSELLPADRATFFGTLVQLNNCCTYAWVALYFWFIS